MKALLALLVLALWLPACATTGNFEKNIATYLGRDSNTLIANLGIPLRTMKLPNGGTVYEYQLGPADSSGSTITRNAFSGALETRTTSYSCVTSFIVSPEDKVISYRYVGNSCRSY